MPIIVKSVKREGIRCRIGRTGVGGIFAVSVAVRGGRRPAPLVATLPAAPDAPITDRSKKGAPMRGWAVWAASLTIVLVLNGIVWIFVATS